MLDDIVNNLPDDIANNLPDDIANNLPDIDSNLPDDIANNLPDDIVNNLPDDISLNDIRKAVNETNIEYYDNLPESKSKLCQHCHKKIPKNSKYCPRCGVRFAIINNLYKEDDK